MDASVRDGQLLSGQEFADGDVLQTIAAQSNKAAGDARKRVQALAALTAFDATGQNRAFTLADNADKLGTLGGMRRGSLGVSNQEQNIAPAQVGYSGSDALGNVLTGVGNNLAYNGGYKSTVSANG
jgi:hypothetical protein